MASTQTAARILECHDVDPHSRSSTPEPVVFENDFSVLDDTDLENNGDAGTVQHQTESLTCRLKTNVVKETSIQILEHGSFESFGSDTTSLTNQFQPVGLLASQKFGDGNGDICSEQVTYLPINLHDESQWGTDERCSSVEECGFLSLPTKFDGSPSDKFLRRQLSDSCTDEQSQHGSLSKASSTDGIRKRNKNTEVKSKKNGSQRKSTQSGTQVILSEKQSRQFKEKLSKLQANTSNSQSHISEDSSEHGPSETMPGSEVYNSDDQSEEDTAMPLSSFEEKPFKPVSALTGRLKLDNHKEEIDVGVPFNSITAAEGSRVGGQSLESHSSHSSQPALTDTNGGGQSLESHSSHSSQPASTDTNGGGQNLESHPSHSSQPASTDTNGGGQSLESHSSHSSQPASTDTNGGGQSLESHPSHSSQPASTDTNGGGQSLESHSSHSSQPASTDTNGGGQNLESHPSHSSQPASTDTNGGGQSLESHSSHSSQPASTDTNGGGQNLESHPSHSSQPASTDTNGGLTTVCEVASNTQKLSLDGGHVSQIEGQSLESQPSQSQSTGQGIQPEQQAMWTNGDYDMMGVEHGMDPAAMGFEPGTSAMGTDTGTLGMEYSGAPDMEYGTGEDFGQEGSSSYPNHSWSECDDQYGGEEIDCSAMYAAAQKKSRPRMMHRRMYGRRRGMGTSPMMMGDMTGEEEGNILSTARSMLQNSGGMSPYQSPLTMLMSVAQSMGVDCAYLMQNAENLGVDIPMPCTECYHKHERGQGQMPVFSMAKSVDVKCPKCGSQRTTIADMGRMILQMRKNIDEEDLIVYDVYPDGNCLFASVIDQLRVRGDFTQTVHTLRQRAVEYLRANPKQEDGTHLKVFLPSEEWEGYLKRMSQDGQWGDHMILGAISEVLRRNIVILGGTAKQFKTTISPTKTKARDEDNLFLGHFGETHYISLRRRNWRETLEKKLRDNLDLTEEPQPAESAGSTESRATDCSHLFQDSAVDFVSGIPLHHLNFFLKQLDHTKLITTNGPPPLVYKSLSPPFASSVSRYEFVGDCFNHLTPLVVPIETYMPDMNVLFPGQASNQTDTDHTERIMEAISSPPSISVYPLDELSFTTHLDLLIKKEKDHPGYIKLVPIDPAQYGSLSVETDGDSCLSYQLWMDCNGDDDEGNPAFKTARRMIDVAELGVKLRSLLGFYCPQWPSEAIEWVTRERPSGWPSDEEVDFVVNGGCNVIAKMSSTLEEGKEDPGQGPDSDMLVWMYTFAVAEKRLATSISNAQRNVYLVFRLLIDYQLNFNRRFPLDGLKSLFFYACECLDVEMWKSRPGSCLLYLIQRLNDCLKGGKIPNYFIHEQNMLEDSTKEDLEAYLVNVNLLRRSIVISLYFMLDKHGLIGSEVGSIMDDVIEGIISFSSHGDVKYSFMESLVPASTQLACNLLMSEQFSSSVDTVHELYQDMLHIYSDIQETMFYRLVYQTIQGLHIGYQWMFAFASDLLYKTTLVPAICEGHSTVSVSDVFGPDIVEYFGNVPIPLLFSITHGDIVSASKVVSLLKEQKMDDPIVKGLRFYLDMYSFTYTLPVKEEFKKALVEHRQAGCQCRNHVDCPDHQFIMLGHLQRLHVQLWYSYLHLDQIKEFRPLMERMEAITDLLDTQGLFKSLSVMWTTLGDEKRARSAQEKANSVDPSASMGLRCVTEEEFL